MEKAGETDELLKLREEWGVRLRLVLVSIFLGIGDGLDRDLRRENGLFIL